MRALFVLFLFSVGFVSTAPVHAQTWTYREIFDPSANGIFLASAWAKSSNLEGVIGISCGKINSDERLIVRADFSRILQEIPSRPADVGWRIDNGEERKIRADSFVGNGYVVSAPKSIELARALMDASQFTTSNGDGGLLEFENLRGGEEINRVLRKCGY